MKQILRFNSLLLLFFSFANLCAQTFTEVEKRQGYTNQGDNLWFVFDEQLYGVQPEKVVVTGQFRGWSQDMDDKAWQLSPKDNGVWTMAVENVNFEKISPLTPFKFRINEGKWLDPPAGTPNEKGGNLEYMQGFILPALQAEMRRPNTIWAKVSGFSAPLQPNAYRLTDAAGKIIPIAAVLPNTASEILIVPAKSVDIKRVYFLEIPAQKLKAFCSFDGWFREIYSDKPLGANISADGKSTNFGIFAPRATGLKLYLYKGADDKKAYKIIPMSQDAQGVWTCSVKGNLKGVYYDFTVHGAADPGNHFFEQTGEHISDPYARVNMNAYGKSRVWEATKPARPLKNGIPKMEDVISYEVHVQDFTDQLPVPPDLKGTMTAMVLPGLRNAKGGKIGFDFLTDLGINTVHLLPMQEFMHFPDDDWKASFKDDPYMIAQGISEENYQWGYRTSHCFAVESKFRQKGTEPGAEREQFRDLVQAFHDQGIAVIIDLVPNHTAENMDALHENFHFNALDQQYYYRTKNFKHIGEYGNEVKTENRPMVQRWLIDQCQHFINEFGIDGFRIDLAGQLDEQTLIALKIAIGHDKILYGEPWIASNDPNYEANPDWDWYKADAPITFFQDDARNAFKGPVFTVASKATDRGWPGGKADERENVKKGLANTFPEDKTPLSGINYLDIHDNWALADQFGSKDFDGRFGVDEAQFKMAATLLYTSLGPIVTHGGTEIMRSKGLAPLQEVVKTTKAGRKIYLHGKRDTYNHRLANNYIWENVGKSTGEKGVFCDYQGMHAFFRGLNLFRLSDYGKALRIAEKPDAYYYRWIEPADQRLLGYLVDGQVLVLMNTSEQSANFDITDLPVGNWKLIGNSKAIDHVNGVKDQPALMSLTGGNHSVQVEQLGMYIWVKMRQ